jgi:putative DNA primase/helicase
VILRPLSNFTGNGVLRGTITALDDLGEPLGWESYGNWSDRSFLERSAKQLAQATGIPLDRARMLLTTAVKEARKLAGPPGSDDDAQATQHELPVIVVNERYLRDLAEDSWQLLAATSDISPQFFQFGSALCDLVSNANGVYPRILTLTSLRNRLDRLADYVSIDQRGDEHPARPRRDLLEDILAQANPPVPDLQGVVRAPVCRPDGSIAFTEGYDSATGLYLALNGLVMPPVVDFPSDREVARAKELLLDELLRDFPFASPSDKAHALSEIMTPMLRQLISGPTPLHLNEAPSPGSGKDLLADCASLIATGALRPAMTEGRDDDEWRKRLTAKLITSPSIVLIDNVKRHLDSGALSAALERPIWEDRHLGLSRMVMVPIKCVWICTANNPSLNEEIARRTARMRIDPQMETPWERSEFKHPDLRKWVRDHRGGCCGRS